MNEKMTLFTSNTTEYKIIQTSKYQSINNQVFIKTIIISPVTTDISTIMYKVTFSYNITKDIAQKLRFYTRQHLNASKKGFPQFYTHYLSSKI